VVCQGVLRQSSSANLQSAWNCAACCQKRSTHREQLTQIRPPRSQRGTSGAALDRVGRSRAWQHALDAPPGMQASEFLGDAPQEDVAFEHLVECAQATPRPPRPPRFRGLANRLQGASLWSPHIASGPARVAVARGAIVFSKFCAQLSALTRALHHRAIAQKEFGGVCACESSWSVLLAACPLRLS
jgi:hypothetical protein